jgi:hypothetical protein
MLLRTESLAVCLNAPIQVLLEHLEGYLHASSGDEHLKRTAINALNNATGRIDVGFDTLKARLHSNLQDTYFQYITETNVYSPVARIMIPIYQDTLYQACLQPGPGSYFRMQTNLRESMTPDYLKDAIPSKFSENMMGSHMALWRQSCGDFVAMAMKELEEFSQITQNLVDNDFYATVGHISFRAQLERSLPTFEARLAIVQRHFPGTDERQQPRPLSKKPRRDETSQRAATQTSPQPTSFRSFMAAPGIEPARASSSVPDLVSPRTSSQPIQHSYRTGFVGQTTWSWPFDPRPTAVKREQGESKFP